MIDIVQCLDDPNLFGPWFAGPSWATWLTVLKAAFGLPLDSPEELTLFRAVAERDPPKTRVRELWAIVGRRGGKDSIASAIACYAAGFRNYHEVLRPGEAASVLCLAVDKAQASIVQRYAQSYFTKIALLRGLVKRETSEGLDLSTGAELAVIASNFRSVRGRSIACVIMDEVAFWRSETTSNPDTETYAALVPSLATIPGSMLIGISTPYRRAGLLWQKHRDHFGQDDDDVLVVQGPSRVFNPTLDQRIVDEALKRDAAAARSEWLGDWRDDIAAFLSRELIEGAVDRGVMVRPPLPDVEYFAFADPSGGLGDSFTAAVAHREEGGHVVLDCLIEKTPPFDPAVATKEIAATLKAYGIGKVVGDRYGAGWVSGEFGRNDLSYEASERDRSAIYADFLPLLTSGRARLLDSPRLVGQLANLERRASPMGRDRIDHPAGAHDDLSNAAAGALVLAGEESGYWSNNMAWVGDPDPAERDLYRQRPLLRHPYFGGAPWLALQ
jgi:hypothetical protein